MNIDDLVRNPEYRNFVCCFHGFAFAGNKLEPYTRNGLQSIQRSVYCKLAGKQAYNQRCSEVFGRQLSSWCETCRKWRHYLGKESKLQTMCWDRMKSWEWPLAHESIAGVFLPASWTKLDLQDIATLCHIWENSKNQFTIRQIVVTNLRACRNTYVAHNPKLSVTELEKAKVFDALKDLFKDRDVQLCTNSQECLSELEKIENGDALSSSLKNVFKSLSENSDAIENLQNTLDMVMHSQTDLRNVVQESCEQNINARETLGKIHEGALGVLHKHVDVVVESCNELTEKQDHIGSRVDEIGDKQIESNDKLQNYHDIVIKLMMEQNRTKVKRKEKFFISGCLLLGAILTVVVSLLYNGSNARKDRYVDENSKRKDCISEKYSYPFEQDMPLLGYFNEHEATVGREWLFETIESKLVTQNSSSRGIVLVAEMGYGKSAFVSHLLCSKQGEKGYGTKSHVVAFHICRFDVKSTQSPERFIRRLVGFLARVSQEYGNIISVLSDYNIIYNKETCDDDPNACFDQGIIFPLKQLSQTSNLPWIFIIEALDECYQKSSSHNPVMELIVSRIRHLPSWFKFIVTSRNMSGLNQFTNIEMIHLQTNDPRNDADIREYIKTKVLDHKFYKSDKELETMVTQTEGNFLFLIHAIQYTVISENQSFLRLPSSLKEVYRVNFDRQFGEKYSFQIPKIIFEIVSATLYPLKEEEILDVLKVNNITDSTDFNAQLNKMSFFLRMDPTVTINHQSLYEWLINIQNKKYRISIKAGHAYISRYLFRQVSKGREADLADFSIHVSEASTDSLTKQFLTLNVSSFNTTNVNEAIHKLISKTSAVNPLKLLIGLNLDIDKHNGNGQTPAFVAAANGNIDQLDLLQEMGANISFVMENDIAIDPYDILQKIDDIKKSRHYGYGLIHVAAKHGHANVFSKLLKYNKEMIYWKTALG